MLMFYIRIVALFSHNILIIENIYTFNYNKLHKTNISV